MVICVKQIFTKYIPNIMSKITLVSFYRPQRSKGLQICLKNFTSKFIKRIWLLVIVLLGYVDANAQLTNRATYSGYVNYALAGSSFRDMPDGADPAIQSQAASLATSASSVTFPILPSPLSFVRSPS